MRVISGVHKGRRLLGPAIESLRPTSGRVKEALFSILQHHLPGSRFLDLYAGTGAIGIEALSRGAKHTVFVESDASSLRLLRTNLSHCGLAGQADVVSQEVGAYLRKAAPPFDIVFADPPYRLDPAVVLLPALERSAMITAHTIVILEHPTKQVLPESSGRLQHIRSYRYGDTSLSTFRVITTEPSS